MALAAFVEVNAVFWRTSIASPSLDRRRIASPSRRQPGKRAIRKAGQQCVENSLKADHNLFAGYYRKLMI
jgi:hypothetical protein